MHPSVSTENLLATHFICIRAESTPECCRCPSYGCWLNGSIAALRPEDAVDDQDNNVERPYYPCRHGRIDDVAQLLWCVLYYKHIHEQPESSRRERVSKDDACASVRPVRLLGTLPWPSLIPTLVCPVNSQSNCGSTTMSSVGSVNGNASVDPPKEEKSLVRCVRSFVLDLRQTEPGMH